MSRADSSKIRRTIRSHNLSPNTSGAGKDWILVQRAIAGDAAAQDHLFAYQIDKLCRIAFSIVGNKEDAEDAVQNGLCKAYTSLCSYQGRSLFSTWLTRVVINSALMLRRSGSRARPQVPLDQSDPKQKAYEIVDTRPGPEKIVAATELTERIEEQIRQLTPRLQTAFRLRAMEGFSVAESCQVLGISTGTFKSRIYRARRKLAHELHSVQPSLQ